MFLSLFSLIINFCSKFQAVLTHNRSKSDTYNIFWWQRPRISFTFIVTLHQEMQSSRTQWRFGEILKVDTYLRSNTVSYYRIQYTPTLIYTPFTIKSNKHMKSSLQNINHQKYFTLCTHSEFQPDTMILIFKPVSFFQFVSSQFMGTRSVPVARVST